MFQEDCNQQVATQPTFNLITGVEGLYTTYKRRKRNGKLRTITAPAEELKTLQAKFNDYLYSQYKPFFDERAYITGFVPERNIVSNANMHLNKEWLINIDLKDFFPSILDHLVISYVLKDLPVWKDLSVEQLRNLVIYEGALPQGSPCSPMIANIVASHLIDEAIVSAAKENGYDYTRYADDITLSTNKLIDRNEVISFVTEIRKIINKSEYLMVNDKKINIKHRSQKQMVTGVLVNNKEAGVNKLLRNKLRGILHQHKLLDKPLDDKVGGILGFIKQVNSEQFTKLTKDFPCRLLTLNYSNQTMLPKEVQKHLDNLS